MMTPEQELYYEEQAEILHYNMLAEGRISGIDETSSDQNQTNTTLQGKESLVGQTDDPKGIAFIS